VNYIGFLRWLLFITLLSIGCCFAYGLGGFHDIWEKDATKLSFVIMAFFLFHTIWCGIKTFTINEQLKHNDITDKIKDIIRFQEIGWFSSDVCLNVGMMGTVVGFIMMLVGFASIDTADVSKIQNLLASMSYGMSTALYTTLVGLVCSQALKIQYFNLTHDINKIIEKFDLKECDEVQ